MNIIRDEVLLCGVVRIISPAAVAIKDTGI